MKASLPSPGRHLWVCLLLVGCQVPTGLFPPAARAEDETPKRYSLEDRPAGEFAGEWRSQGTKDSFVVENNLTGRLHRKSDDQPLEVTFRRDENSLVAVDDEEQTVLELTKEGEGPKLVGKGPNMAEQAEFVKILDPITGLVVENADRTTALRRAGVVVRELHNPDAAKYPEYREEELRRITQHHFNSFPVIPTGSRQTVSINAHKLGFDAIRFRTPAAEHRWDMHWNFIFDRAFGLDGWFIVPPNGQMEGFSNYRFVRNVAIEGLELPEENIQMIQSLTGGQLDPDQEYLLWFSNANNHEKSFKFFIEIQLVEAE